MYLADEYTLEAVSIIVTIYYIGRRSESLRHARHGPGETRGAGAGAALALRWRCAVGVRSGCAIYPKCYAKITTPKYRRLGLGYIAVGCDTDRNIALCYIAEGWDISLRVMWRNTWDITSRQAFENSQTV